jgi:glycerol-3-phosphate dehydrogenase
VRRWAYAYGTRALNLLSDAKTMADLGEDFGAGLSRREVDYLVREEWARTAEDILWRRSKLGLHITAEGAARLAAYLAEGGPALSTGRRHGYLEASTK